MIPTLVHLGLAAAAVVLSMRLIVIGKGARLRGEGVGLLVVSAVAGLDVFFGLNLKGWSGVVVLSGLALVAGALNAAARAPRGQPLRRDRSAGQISPTRARALEHSDLGPGGKSVLNFLATLPSLSSDQWSEIVARHKGHSGHALAGLRRELRARGGARAIEHLDEDELRNAVVHGVVAAFERLSHGRTEDAPEARLDEVAAALDAAEAIALRPLLDVRAFENLYWPFEASIPAASIGLRSELPEPPSLRLPATNEQGATASR